jgi:hypothetical protein
LVISTHARESATLLTCATCCSAAAAAAHHLPISITSVQVKLVIRRQIGKLHGRAVPFQDFSHLLQADSENAHQYDLIERSGLTKVGCGLIAQIRILASRYPVEVMVVVGNNS